ncbi:MAG: HDOD domain-containing protein [Polyangiaceae bacterium]|nr:HDOD domain-containing protein [Polyangiaceae bacterium]
MSATPKAAPKPPPLPASQRQIFEQIREDLWFGDADPNRTELSAAKSMAAATGKALGLKPFPVVAQKVLSLLSNPDTHTSKITDAIEKDPGLTVKLLQVTNSVMYRGATDITNISDAVVRLGRKTVMELVAGVAAMGMFSDTQGSGLTIRNHCARVAAIGRVLSTEWKYKKVDSIFISGLLHDVGKLLMMQVGDIDYNKLDQTAVHTPDEIHLHERAQLGFDHAVLGAHVLVAWKIPDSIASIVALHHQPGRAYAGDPEKGLPVALLRLADKIEYQLLQDTALDDAFARAVAADDAATYAEYSADMLVAMWPKFVESTAEIVSILK